MLSGCKPSTSLDGAVALDHLLLTNPARHWKLHQNAVDLAGLIQLAHQTKQRLLGCRGGQTVDFSGDTDLCRGLFLVAHVNGRCWIFAD